MRTDPAVTVEGGAAVGGWDGLWNRVRMNADRHTPSVFSLRGGDTARGWCWHLLVAVECGAVHTPGGGTMSATEESSIMIGPDMYSLVQINSIRSDIKLYYY